MPELTTEQGKCLGTALVDIQKKLINEHQKKAEQALNYIYQIVTITGVIAGFGFVSMSNANSALLFLGELCLFSTIVGSLLVIKLFWIPGLKETEEYQLKIDQATQDLKKALIEQDGSQMFKIYNVLYTDSAPKKTNTSEILEKTLTLLFFGLTLGCLFLFLAFFVVQDKKPDSNIKRQENSYMQQRNINFHLEP